MTRSADTLGDAREILLGRRSATIKLLDTLLGAGILAAGPIGLATGQPWLLAAWGWIDQKNELIVRLDELVRKGRAKLRKSSGRPRHELLAATHAALTAGAFFAALRDELGPVYDELELTEADLARLSVTADQREALHKTVDLLLRIPIDLPWSGRGFEANLKGQILPHYLMLTARCLDFFTGFRAFSANLGEYSPRRADAIAQRAAERYRADFLGLAAEIPEFRIWAEFGEHLAEQNALARIEELTRFLAAPAKAARPALRNLHRAVLAAPIVDLEEATGDVTAVRVPSVERGYIEPAFRWAVMGPDSLPAHEDWWGRQPLGLDLAGFVAAHVVSPAAAERPMVVLGHPGSGKSLFTKVCAARLDAFVTVRVPLRDVPDPTAGVYRQIDDVLRAASHEQVEWRTLCESGGPAVRVVLIDGLDELMQATGATESRYLRNVMDFQRTEAAVDGPVSVIVTSRTLVADLAAIPEGCLVVRLEEFTDEQIDAWAGRWAEANEPGVAAGQVRPVAADALRGYGDLARQPLLLLLLAIVAADRELPADGTSVGLYRMLLDDYIRRELARPDNQASGLAEDERREAELWKLGLVAFGMLNRGRQHLAERDLEADLLALPGPIPVAEVQRRDLGRSLDPARRIIGRFFFVVAAEADGGAGGRSYEFLHATFGDYLVAFHTFELLRDAAAARSLRTASQSWDDDLLFALLSQRLLAGYGSRALGLFAEQARGDAAVAGVLEHIAAIAQDRWGPGRHAAYAPSSRVAVQRIATYSANIVSLRLAMADEPVELARLCPPHADVRSSWANQVRLWDAALQPLAGRAAFISGLHVVDGDGLTASWRPSSGYLDEMVEIAALNEPRAMQLAAGRALLTGDDGPMDQPGPAMARDLAELLLRGYASPESLAILADVSRIPGELHDLALSAAARHGGSLDAATANDVLTLRSKRMDEAHAMLAVRHGIPVKQTGSSELWAIMLRLGAQLNGVRSGGVSDTPEGRAMLALPPELARKLIPELAASLLSAREQDQA
ncbi:NACHT domain-containing protein [Dactylosporangium sp. CA-139114]|uniref:NACHT domain-containing protein n=1 Tax=Dactylosporangium sp. CA-139114 TaxID=3239931 RepID=UPI003D9549EF